MNILAVLILASTFTAGPAVAGHNRLVELDDELVRLSMQFPRHETPLAIASQPRVYVELDGRWYGTVDASPIPGFSYAGPQVMFPAASMTFCVRENGQPQVFGGLTVYVSFYYYPLYQIRRVRYRPLPGVPGSFMLIIESTPGDLQCQGQISNPIPNTIFGDGFEGGVIFRNGFEPN